MTIAFSHCYSPDMPSLRLGFLSKVLVFFLFFTVSGLFAQGEPPKFALVIGNSAYTNVSRLANPVNDAADISDVLTDLGFTVDTVLNGTLDQMENAVIRLKNRLSVSEDCYGFFFYAGHGVQSGGENFLLPVDANIPSESFLRQRAVSVQSVLNELNNAENHLNIVVLDACRDNPFSRWRSSARGLAVASNQPADSIVVYATSAGSVADDGAGRNGLFTRHLLENLKNPGLEVSEVFRRTGADVASASNRQQIPAIYNQFFGVAYLGAGGMNTGITTRPKTPVQILPQTGRSPDPSRLWSVGVSAGSSFSAPWAVATVRGTLAPFRYSFLEIGVDTGFVSGVQDVGYYSVFPYVNYSLYLPFSIGRINCGWYLGAGGGYWIAEYDYPQGKVPWNTFAVNAVTGFNIADAIDISYSLRTNFEVLGGKLSVGYSYRF